MSRGLALTAAIALLGSAAHADVDYFKGNPKPNAVAVHQGNDRTTGQRRLIAGLAAGTTVALGVGVYFNLDSRDAAKDVSSHVLTGSTWSAGDQATYDRAHSSGVKAAIGYGVAGALAAALIITIVETDPGERLVDLDSTAPTATITPTSGGAIVGATWGF